MSLKYAGSAITDETLFHYPQRWFGDPRVLMYTPMYPTWDVSRIGVFLWPAQRVYSPVDLYEFLSSDFLILLLCNFAVICCLFWGCFFDVCFSLFFEKRCLLQSCSQRIISTSKMLLAVNDISENVIWCINNDDSDTDECHAYNTPFCGLIFCMLTDVVIPDLICKCTVPFVKTWVILYGPLNLSSNLDGS